jgi:uncharacterized membrane protein
MPILIMALLALSVFVVLLFLLIGAMSAEHRQRRAEGKQNDDTPKATAHTAGR